MLRTAAIMGQVSVEGEGLGDVTVSLSGEGESLTTMTDMSGQYAFSDLPAGNFQVGISGYETDDVSFETTSKNVALALGGTATVPFKGILLRTSGISGRVSVEGTGLDSVTVTLSGDDLDEDRKVMTDATGQYTITGLAEGDYTVAISDYDAVAFIFETTSKDVTLGDDDAQIVSFKGEHARTASVSGMIFADEAAKNDTLDVGEHALAAPGVVLALVGPGILDRDLGATGPDGSFSFGELRAGPYQLVVANATAAGADYAYGGPAAGYGFNLGVGDEETQDIPFDITHTTINFDVTLKAGDKTGAALEDATVTLYSDLAGELKITDEMTDEDGRASIRIARAGTTGNTVYAAVAAPAGSYDTDGDMQAVMWNPQMTMAAASNSADIVNTMASFSFGGATIMTDMGGGNALGGWKVSVTSGADDEAVDGAPAALGADGMASFSETVTSVPKTYTITMADDQANDSTGDGGEKYTSTTLSHTHDGLSLSGTSTDAGMLEVTYTTQTLRVYVHEEIDQVMGYTGNVLGGDRRMGGIIDVDIEHIASNGRATSFEATDSVRSSARGGVYQFWNVPAAANVIVTADEFPTLGTDADGDPIANTAHLLDKNGHSDELAAYTDMEANGIRGGAFGAHGGFHHTVDLCPLMSDEGDQRHGECSTFAFVETYAVNGQAWKWVRGKTSDDFASANAKAGARGLTVSMDPVDNENLAGVDESFTEKGNTKVFNFNRMPAGVYKVTVPTGWIAQRGPLESPTNDLAARVSPLDSALNIDVTPTTGYAYGRVTDGENRRMAGVTVNVNGVSVETDSNGRYVAEGFGAASCRLGTRTVRNVICVTTAEEGSEETANAATFRANSPTEIDVTIKDATEVTTISGRVTHSDGGAGVGGVVVWVDGQAPINKNARYGRTTTNNAYRTAGDGSFSVRIAAKTGGASATVTVERDGMFFSPEQHTVGAVAGATISGINFTAFDNGTIHGRVVDARNNPIGGVLVTAQQVGGTAMDTMTTSTATGSYSLSVRYGQYGVTAAKPGYTFTDTTGVNVPNDGKAQNDLIGTQVTTYSYLSSLSLSGVSRLCRTEACPATARGFRSAHEDYTATVGNSLSMTTLTTTAGGGARVIERYPEDADATTAGHQIALEVGLTEIEVKVASRDNTDTTTYKVDVTRRASSTVITGTITDAEPDDEGNTVGVSGVQITVTGAGDLLNGTTRAGRTYVTTNASGQYTAVMESGGIGTVTPTKTGYSFEPADLEVRLNADSVKGIDFTGSSFATITGTVMANGAALEGATVTATNGGKSDSDTSDRRGRFSVSVPAGTITITASKLGYDFGSQTVFADAGESRSIGNVMATGNVMPLNVAVERDTAVSDGYTSYIDDITVTWDRGVSGAADAYQVQVQDALGLWEPFGDRLMALTAGKGSATADGKSFADFTNGFSADTMMTTFRVVALTDTDTSSVTEYGDTLASATVRLGPVDPKVDSVTARRAIDPVPDSLYVTWEGALGNGDSEWRVLISFDSGTTWYVGNGRAGSGRWTPTLEPSSFTSMPVADDADADPKSAEQTELDGAFMIRVDYRQRDVRGDNSTPVAWKTGPTASVGEK
ncbi:MAG: carboxypeptidase regulatory-like domain-containing protein [Gemmatimonadetes bacterium]|nr:carboxypeptidase regulatory-like domain-containing protein [Gemmatimonadota bacterium]